MFLENFLVIIFRKSPQFVTRLLNLIGTSFAAKMVLIFVFLTYVDD